LLIHGPSTATFVAVTSDQKIPIVFISSYDNASN